MKAKGTFWFLQGVNCKRGFNTRLTLESDLNHVAPEKLADFLNKYLALNEEIKLFPQYWS